MVVSCWEVKCIDSMAFGLENVNMLEIHFNMNILWKQVTQWLSIQFFCVFIQREKVCWCASVSVSVSVCVFVCMYLYLAEDEALALGYFRYLHLGLAEVWQTFSMRKLYILYTFVKVKTPMCNSLMKSECNCSMCHSGM